MCLKDSELQAGEEIQNLTLGGSVQQNNNNNNRGGGSCKETSWSLSSQILNAQMNNPSPTSSFPLEGISEETTIAAVASDRHDKQGILGSEFTPNLRSGEWSDIGRRPYMEDTHTCIFDLAKKFPGSHQASPPDDHHRVVSFYGVFDGHGGKAAAQFVRDHLPRVIVEDADFPLQLEKVVARSFIKTDAAFERSCSADYSLSSGTTVLTAMILGRSLLVANAGDCRAVLSRQGKALELSEDHRHCSDQERHRVESMGGYFEDGYLNGQLGVTRALGNWHLEGLKHKDTGNSSSGPLSAEPEMRLVTLTKEDEFLIIGSDGIWDVFSSQNAVDFARRRLQAHNDVKLCCKEVVEEAIIRGASDNLTVVMVCFHLEPPQRALSSTVVVPRARVRRSISAEGIRNLSVLLGGNLEDEEEEEFSP